jgi:hypothetical protein
MVSASDVAHDDVWRIASVARLRLRERAASLMQVFDGNDELLIFAICRQACQVDAQCQRLLMMAVARCQLWLGCSTLRRR